MILNTKNPKSFQEDKNFILFYIVSIYINRCIQAINWT